MTNIHNYDSQNLTKCLKTASLTFWIDEKLDLNFAGSSVGLEQCRAHFPALSDSQSIVCDGAAGSQVISKINL